LIGDDDGGGPVEVLAEDFGGEGVARLGSLGEDGTGDGGSMDDGVGCEEGGEGQEEKEETKKHSGRMLSRFWDWKIVHKTFRVDEMRNIARLMDKEAAR
jgi:hypothetical protein